MIELFTTQGGANVAAFLAQLRASGTHSLSMSIGDISVSAHWTDDDTVLARRRVELAVLETELARINEKIDFLGSRVGQLREDIAAGEQEQNGSLNMLIAQGAHKSQVNAEA